MPTPPSVRPPRQDRTRESWQRVLDTGLELLESGGWDALTVSEVCRRCGISAPSLYARVDGRLGLFYAVYDYGMQRVAASQARAAAEVRPEDGIEAAARQAVQAMLSVFEAHEGLLRAVIIRAAIDDELRRRGALLSRIAIRDLMGGVPGRRVAVEAVGRTIFAECVVRIIYGAEFFTPARESSERFVDRLTTLAVATIAAAGPAVDGAEWPVAVDPGS
jgi:AcrR family transcriptional regulator